MRTRLPHLQTTTLTRTTQPHLRLLPTTRKMASSTPSASDLNIEATSLTTSPGVSLSSTQQTLVGSVLDLFAGRPSLGKLRLWTDDAEFTDPLTIAKGRKQYEAQWYGLQTAFSGLERVKHEVKTSGNPIELDLTMHYTVKGIGKEQTINSLVKIHTDAAGERITKVEDRWDGKLPESGIAKAFQRLNAVTVPHVVGVPKNEEEDAKRGN